MDIKKAKKLIILENEPNLVFYDEIQSLKGKLEKHFNALQAVLSDINNKEVYTYQNELKTLQSALQSLTESVINKDTVVNIPLDQLKEDLGNKLIQLTDIVKNIKFPEVPNSIEISNLPEFPEIPEFPINDLEKIIEGLGKKIESIKFEGNEFDYDFLRGKFERLIKAIQGISVTVNGGGFPDQSKEDLQNIRSNQTNGTQQSQILGKTSDTTYQVPRIDPSTHSLQVVDYAHHEIHDGSFFTYCDVVTLGNGASQDYLVTVPNTTKWPHLGYFVDFNDGAGTLRIFEATDKTGTTIQTAYNRNRNSATTPTTTVHKGTSGGTTDGTMICHRRAGSGKSLSGTAGSSGERILKQNTKYIIRITNETTSDNNVTVEFDWYEHTNKIA